MMTMPKLCATLVCFSLLGAIQPLWAQELRGPLTNCLAVQGVLQRLACYDGVARGLGAVTPPSENHSAPMLLSPLPPRYPAQVAAPSQLGSERLPQTVHARPPSSRMIAGIVKFENTLRGQFILTLSNGQVWRQIEGDTAIATPRASARSVAIERAIFGSYALTFNDGQQRYKVTRVQ